MACGEWAVGWGILVGVVEEAQEVGLSFIDGEYVEGALALKLADIVLAAFIVRAQQQARAHFDEPHCQAEGLVRVVEEEAVDDCGKRDARTRDARTQVDESTNAKHARGSMRARVRCSAVW